MDQGQIGSCTAHAGAAAMAFLEKKEKRVAPFSRLFIYAMTRRIEGTPLTEDSGAEIRDVMKALSTYGAPYETDWPYDGARFSEEPSVQAKQNGQHHKALMYYRCPSLFTVQASIHHGFPVIFGFSVPDNAMSDRCTRTGIVLPPERGEAFNGSHAVLAIGYDKHFACGPERGAVLCQNSWGTGWGIDGFFWLPMSFFYGGAGALASDCWTLRRIQT